MQHAITTNEPAPRRKETKLLHHMQVVPHRPVFDDLPPSQSGPDASVPGHRTCQWRGIPEDSSVRAAEGHACRDTFLIGNQLLDSEAQGGEGCAKQNHVPFQRLRPWEHFGRGCIVHEGRGYPCLDQRTACSLLAVASIGDKASHCHEALSRFCPDACPDCAEEEAKLASSDFRER